MTIPLRACDVSVITDFAYNGTGTTVTLAAYLALTGAAATDNCNIASVTYQDAQSISCPIEVTRTWRVTDDASNTTTVTQTITVDDTVDPTASNPAQIDVQCIGDVPVPNVNLVTDEADNCTAAPVVAFVSDVSDGNTCPETITRTYSVTDDCGNTINVTQLIVIDHTTPPAEVSGPMSNTSTVECLADAVAPTTLPVIHDVCGNVLSPAAPTHGGTYVNCEGTYTWEYLYTDCSGLTYTWVYTYNIDITTPPAEVGGPVSNSSTVECLADAVAPTTFPVIQDVCGNVLTPAAPTHGGTYAGCEGTYTWEYLYTDCSGLTYTWVYTYNIDITTPPAEVGGPVSTSGGTVECLSDAVAPTTFPVIHDVCGNVLVPVLQPNGGTYVNCEGTYTWEYLYTDCSGLDL